MAEASILPILLAITFGVLFYLVDFYHHHVRIHKSLIAGISIAYFFQVVLPEISEGLPEYPLHLVAFEYFFVLLGFTFIHISEKLILQQVESKSQHRMRELVQRERNLEVVEHNVHEIITNELNEPELHPDALRELARTTRDMKTQEIQIKVDIQIAKKKIHDHINKDIDELQFITGYFYHFLIGVIMIGLLLVDLFSGILFFLFAFFMAMVSKHEGKKMVFSDLDIEIKVGQIGKKKYILATSAITGVICGIFLDLFVSLNLEVLYILFSFISGVILYTIVREVIPEKEKGKPLYFLVGFLAFSLFLLLVRYLEHKI
jgi:zinc transporter ZupT